ncbi:MAG: hypothetical protein HBSAPP02_05690 [Phycisphaerae bacterium]|nr:MAG: hypothetical protein HBSAPP02_05690 [Phycisphaerae bacterium]
MAGRFEYSDARNPLPDGRGFDPVAIASGTEESGDPVTPTARRYNSGNTASLHRTGKDERAK